MEPINYYYYLDTNTFLHYTFFTDIDWCEALNLKKVTLVMCYPVLKELERQKIYNPKGNLRKRSAKVVREINSRLDAGVHSTLRKNVNLEFTKKRIDIDWDKEELNPDIIDDYIIAYVISDERINKKIITTDPGLKLTAGGKGIKCLSLPEKYRLEIKDKRDKEIEKLKRQLDKKPKLQLKILGDKDYSKICKIKLRNPPQIQVTKIEEYLENIKEDLLNKEKENKEVMRRDAQGVIRIKKYMQYESIINDLVDEHKYYFKKYYQFIERSSRIHKINLVILNAGNWPASDIEINLSFLGDIKILKTKALPSRPSLLSLYVSLRDSSASVFDQDIKKHNIYAKLEKKFKEEEEKIGTLLGAKLLNSLKLSEKLNIKILPWNNIGSRITASMDKLKHNDKAFLDIYIELAKNINTVFSIECEMKIVELPEIIKDKVIVKIENKK